MADFWMLEKQLVHKLFKVLVPRYENFTGPISSMYKAPRLIPIPQNTKLDYDRCVLELKGHPFPPIFPNDTNRNKNLIHNVLLDAAKKEFYKENKSTIELENALNADDTIEIKDTK